MSDRMAIRQAMATLSGPHRAIIYRAYYLGRSTAQIAAEDRTDECDVRARLHDATRELLHKLRDVHATA
jgi:RNA polymerase sigma-70 factor (ECF subfamily)